MIEPFFTSLFYSIRVQDFLDIAIISILIYGLLIWFKETASRFVMVGIGLLLLVYLASRYLQLYVTALVFQSFFSILIIVLVVIFQEDLRRFFERLALWGRLRKESPGLSHERDIEVIVQTAISLMKKRHGALIVIQGNDPLDRHLEGGTLLEGRLSQPLLESIFDPHSIGHDGAVVIDRGRVVRFGCHLPLSTNSKRFGDLGLRHTAALGLSERSDALVVAVSEERGTISVALEEGIRVLENERELREVLLGFFEKKTPRGGAARISSRLSRNFREKSAAVVLASILWVLFGYQKDLIRRDFMVPIEYHNLAGDWEIEEPKITEAKVMLMGSVQAFRLLNVNTLKISLDLSRILEGRNEWLLTKEMVKAPSNLTITGIEPDRIRLTASRLHRQLVSVEVRTEGRLPSRLILGRISVTPSYIPVLASRKARTRGIRIQTEPVDLSQITSTTTLFPKILFPSEARRLEETPSSVKVIVEVHQRSQIP